MTPNEVTTVTAHLHVVIPLKLARNVTVAHAQLAHALCIGVHVLCFLVRCAVACLLGGGVLVGIDPEQKK